MGVVAPPGDINCNTIWWSKKKDICTYTIVKDNTIVSAPAVYLAHVTPWRQQAFAPPEVLTRTWRPTSAPRHTSATPDRVQHKHNRSNPIPRTLRTSKKRMKTQATFWAKLLWLGCIYSEYSRIDVSITDFTLFGKWNCTTNYCVNKALLLSSTHNWYGLPSPRQKGTTFSC